MLSQTSGVYLDEKHRPLTSLGRLLSITTCERENVFLLNAFVWPVVDHHMTALVKFK